jgi:hypothetical protein
LQGGRVARGPPLQLATCKTKYSDELLSALAVSAIERKRFFKHFFRGDIGPRRLIVPLNDRNITHPAWTQSTSIAP